MINYLKDNKISTMNNTKYILIDLPFYNKIIGLSDILHEIKCQGYIPIIAHPERYYCFQKDYNLVKELKSEGILFQCNYFSLMGYYGRDAKKLFKYLLKDKFIDFLGTDVHSRKQIKLLNKLEKVEKKIIKMSSQSYYDEIQNNCKKLICKS